MKLAAFDAFCQALPGSTLAVQWGDSHVYKIGGKMYAWGKNSGESYIFKASPMAFEVLREQGLATRAPYLPRGHWLKVLAGAMPEVELQAYIAQSYKRIGAALPKTVRGALGL